MALRTKVLFLCIGNACRSQMAEAIAKHVASDVIEPSSAGLVAFGEIPNSTIAVLKECGFSADGQHSKSLRSEDLSVADLVVNMTGRAGSTIFTGPTRSMIGARINTISIGSGEMAVAPWRTSLESWRP